ncbi:AAA family ATPase [Parafrankia discariae]|uniref:AAA family ATPase n=1 Tax=Parafrankia discariae TaxID=365528 RepID=UPI000365429F|nr:ATP-binding protein [Parafrankia discariae]
MARAELREIRLTAFKSFSGAVLPLSSFTVLTGRNSSGKSNALDGIEVLARLAGGEDLSDALDGRRREGGPVRGGSRGCAPHGSSGFQLGCTVSLDGQAVHFDVEVQVDPDLRIISETLSGPAPTVSAATVDDHVLLRTRPAPPAATAIEAETFNGRRGRNPVHTFRDSRLVISQLAGRLPARNRAEKAVLDAADAVVTALRGTFHLDPVPHLMRDYVPGRDHGLRRTGENLSAAIGQLITEDPGAFARLQDLVREVADAPAEDIIVTRSSLGDVMLAIREGSAPADLTPARELSDGLLRFMAVATALLTAADGLDLDPGVTDGSAAKVLLVIEEIENGLHPSQASRMLALIQKTIEERDTQVVVTTHSPALLNALPGSLNQDVIVCFRGGEHGLSELSRLTDLDGYAEAMASGRLGDLIALDRMVRPEVRRRDFADFDRLLGIE